MHINQNLFKFIIKEDKIKHINIVIFDILEVIYIKLNMQ